MKKIATIALTITLSAPLLGLIGRCIDNSTHLKTRYDNKEYHFVECYCDCTDTLKECPRCGHKHMAQEQFIVSTPKSAIVAKSATEEKRRYEKEKRSTDPRAALAALVKNYEKQNRK